MFYIRLMSQRYIWIYIFFSNIPWPLLPTYDMIIFSDWMLLCSLFVLKEIHVYPFACLTYWVNICFKLWCTCDPIFKSFYCCNPSQTDWLKHKIWFCSHVTHIPFCFMRQYIFITKAILELMHNLCIFLSWACFHDLIEMESSLFIILYSFFLTSWNEIYLNDLLAVVFLFTKLCTNSHWKEGKKFHLSLIYLSQS